VHHIKGEMDMSEHNQIDASRELCDVPEVVGHMFAIIIGSMCDVWVLESHFKSMCDVGRQRPESWEKRTALHARFPEVTSPEAVPMHELDPKPVRVDPQIINDPPRSQQTLIEVSQRLVVVTAEDRQPSASVAECGEWPQTRTCERVLAALPRDEPEVAEVANDCQSVSDFEPINDFREPFPTFWTVMTKMNVTEKIIGHNAGFQVLKKGGRPSAGSSVVVGRR